MFFSTLALCDVTEAVWSSWLQFTLNRKSKQQQAILLLLYWHSAELFWQKKKNTHETATLELSLWNYDATICLLCRTLQRLQFCCSAQQAEGAWCKWAKQHLTRLSLDEDIEAEEGRRKVSVAESHKWFPSLKFPLAFSPLHQLQGQRRTQKIIILGRKKKAVPRTRGNLIVATASEWHDCHSNAAHK